MSDCTTRIISIEGNIGTGKSTFIQNLQNRIEPSKDIIFLQEPVDDWNSIKDENNVTILERYYADQDKFAFQFQMMAYISRIALLRKALRQKPRIIITERSVMTDKNVFASMLKADNKIDHIGYAIYERWFNEFLTDLPTFTFVYLRCSPEISASRVAKRNRPGEKIPLEYLQRCHTYHDKWLISGDKESYASHQNATLCLAADSDFDKDPSAMENCFKAVLNLIENSREQPTHSALSIKTRDLFSYKIMFDGASRGNPGISSTGFVIYQDGVEVLRGGRVLPSHHTNNYAEYMALVDALKAVLKLSPWPNNLHIEGDSMLVIKQVTGEYAVRSESLIRLHTEVKRILEELSCKTTFQHIKREKNKIADSLANEAIDAQSSLSGQ